MKFKQFMTWIFIIALATEMITGGSLWSKNTTTDTDDDSADESGYPVETA